MGASKLFLALAAFPLSAWLLAQLLKRASRLPVDHPNERSLHSRPIPRFGGLALLGAVALVTLAGWWSALPAWLFGALLVMAVSLADDFSGLGPAARLLVQMLAALLFVLTTLSGHPWMVQVGAWLSVIWMCNLYNFMDGADGLAGGMALFGFAAYACLAWLAGDAFLLALCLALAAASLGFLCFNLPPARVFMGDAGSVPIGFLAAAVGWVGALRGHWDWAVPLVIFSPFIVDASVTLVRRALRGEKVWQAHREHYYQRMVRMGLGHARTAGIWYVLMLCCASSAVFMVTVDASRTVWLLPLWAVVYLVGLTVVDRRWARHGRTIAGVNTP